MADGTNINLESEIEDYKERCREWFKTEVTEENSGRFRDLIKVGANIEKKIEAKRKSDKEPHLVAGKEIDAAAAALVEPVTKGRNFLNKMLTDFAKALEQKRMAEAREAARKAEEARKAAEVAAETAPDPFAAFDAQAAETKAVEAQSIAQERVQISSTEGVGRAVSLKVVGWIVTVTDAPVLVAHFANHPDVIEAARKAAQTVARSTKGAVAIPGAHIEADRKVA